MIICWFNNVQLRTLSLFATLSREIRLELVEDVYVLRLILPSDCGYVRPLFEYLNRLYGKLLPNSFDSWKIVQQKALCSV